MSSDNEYLDLPDDPEEAFAVLNRRKFNFLQEKWDNDQGGNTWCYERQYVDSMVAFDEVHALGILIIFNAPPRGNNEFSEYFQDFRRHAEISSQKILMESARRHKNGVHQVIILDENARKSIHALIDAIREKLNAIDLSENKRDALFKKLNTFAAEIDLNRTRAEAFYAFAFETARAARAVNDEIKPLQQTIDRVFDFLEKAKKWGEALPPWSDRKKIAGPPKSLPKPDRGNDLDDEIPF